MHTRNRNPMLRWQDPPSSDEDYSSERDSDEDQEGSTECIELLSDEDDDLEVIEILSSDLEDEEEDADEDEEDIQVIDVTTPAPTRTRHAVLDLCGSQVKYYLEDDATQRQVYLMYIDGSHRPLWPVATSMSAGGYCLKPPAPWFNFSCLLLGGKPGSLRAELGAVWVGCGRLSKAISERRVHTGSSEIHMHTDCQSVAFVLKRPKARVPPQYRALITGIKAQLRRLKQLLPVRLKWVKGHQKVDCDDRRGNDAADSRAHPYSLTTCELLPSDTAGARAPDQAAANAAWQELLRERSRRQKRQAMSQKHQQAGRLQHQAMKRRGKKWSRRVEQQTAAAHRAAAWWRHEQQPPPLPPQQQQQQAQPQQWQPQPPQQQKQPPWLCPAPQQHHGLVPGAGAPPPQLPPPSAAVAATSAAWQQPPMPQCLNGWAPGWAPRPVAPVGMAMQSRPLPAAAAAAPRAPPPPLPPMRQPARTHAAVMAAAAVALPESPVRVVVPVPKLAPVVICIDC